MFLFHSVCIYYCYILKFTSLSLSFFQCVTSFYNVETHSSIAAIVW